MPLEQKEILDAIEEGTKKVKADFEKARQEDQASFDKKVNAILDELGVTEMEKKTQEAVKAAQEKFKESLETAEEGLQKNFDEFAAKYAKQNAGPGKGKKIATGIRGALEDNIEKIKDLGGSDSHVFQLKDMGFEDFTGYSTFTQDIKDTVIPQKEEAFHVRQILGAGTTTGDTVYYPKGTGKTGDGPDAWDYDKAAVASTVAKPDFEMTFDNVSAPVKWIAGILRIPKQMLDDLSWLQSYLATYAPIELLKAEDAQLLTGDGTGNNISGLIPNAVAYNQDVAYAGIERIIAAAWGQMALVNQDMPTNVLLNPVDVVSIILNKASGSGEYNLPTGSVGFVNGVLQMAGLTVSKTNKITAGNFLVGDFQRGAALVTRQAPQLRAFEQDRDNVQKNMITFRIEERIALPIFYDDAFVTGALSGT